ncbi:CooT family nickel-binding protein [Desulfobulbus sp. F4]|nr:CooT family nickel-binding protein [Desulfobulbus sp. F3]MCW5200766.1 CooT family nickel-binding protein [Desulfobulbus sp. F4]
MCQLKAVLERGDRCETLMESVTGMEVTEDGVILSTYFEEPLTLRGVRIRSVDLLNGAILLMEQNKENDR